LTWARVAVLMKSSLSRMIHAFVAFLRNSLATFQALTREYCIDWSHGFR